jgi:hypothetical protein
MKDLPEPGVFATAFAPGLNPFGISITKIFPPEDIKSASVRKAYLIKLIIVLNVDHDLWKYLEKILARVRKEKMFCNIWTPEISPVGVDDYGAYAELTSYLQTGTEAKLLHLDKVIKASPVLGKGAEMSMAQERDRVFVETFVEEVRGGKELEAAMETTRKVKPVSKERVKFGPSDKYVIGKTVVVQGKVAKRLSEAEKRVEEDLED